MADFANKGMTSIRDQMVFTFGNMEREIEKSVGKEAAQCVIEKEMTIFCLTLHSIVSVDFTKRLLNERAKWWHILLTTLGIVALICPILVGIDRTTRAFVPPHVVQTVATLATSESYHHCLPRNELPTFVWGSIRTAQVCMKILSVAHRVSEADRRNDGAFVAGCAGILMMLLVALRMMARRRRVLSVEEKRDIVEMAEAIRLELAQRRRDCAGEAKVDS